MTIASAQNFNNNIHTAGSGSRPKSYADTAGDQYAPRQSRQQRIFGNRAPVRQYIGDKRGQHHYIAGFHDETQTEFPSSQDQYRKVKQKKNRSCSGSGQIT